MSFIQKIFDQIELRRGSKSPLFFVLVLLKDVLWFFSYFIPTQIIKLIQNKTQKSLLFFYGLFDHYRVPAEKYYKISFCITCMDRLGHLQKTLAKNIKDNYDYPRIEFVLLDYNSSDGLEDWVFANFQEELRSGLLVYYRTTESPHFQMARAKNLAHQMASGEIVCNLDADNYTGKDFAFYINLINNRSTDIIGLQKYNHYFLQGHISDCGGRIFLTKENFLKLGGYNESFIGWGKEDRELIVRAGNLGLKEQTIPRYFLGAVKHSNHLRVKNMAYSITQADEKNDWLLQKSTQGKDFYVNNQAPDPVTIKRIRLKEQEVLAPGVLRDEIWAITTFFNPRNHQQKLRNYRLFRERLRRQGVKLLTVELAFKKSWFVLKDEEADCLLSLRSDSVLWQKERLLNIALKNLPPHCRYVVWLDADILFLDDDWLIETVKRLQFSPVVQCFSQAVYLQKKENWRQLIKNGVPKERLIQSFASHYEEQKELELPFKTAGGLAWAARREILEAAGFYDYNILGGGDWKMIEAFIGRFLEKDYESSWAKKIRGLINGQVTCVPGTLLHLYHGELGNRLYSERQRILDKHQFDPRRDLELNQDGCWRWSKQAGRALKKEVGQYFQLRNEGNSYLLSWLNQGIYQKIPGLKPGELRSFTFRAELDHLVGQVGIILKKRWPSFYEILKRK